jgi:hypothetical protein
VPPARASAYRCGEAWSILLEHASGRTALIQGSAGVRPRRAHRPRGRGRLPRCRPTQPSGSRLHPRVLVGDGRGRGRPPSTPRRWRCRPGRRANATSARNALPSVPSKAVMGRADQVPSPARPSAVRLAIRVGGGERGSAQARNALEHHRDGDGLRAALRGLRGRRAEDVGTSQSSPSMRSVARGIGDQSSGTRSICPGRMTGPRQSQNRGLDLR